MTRLDDLTEDEFYANNWTDDELIQLAEQTRVETISIELAQITSVYPQNRWRAGMISRLCGYFNWHDSTPLRAIASIVILTYLADRTAEAYYDIPF